MAKVYASSDWHGCGKIANQILNQLQPDDILYFLGDAIDRAPDGIEILNKLLNRPNTYFLKGNHEEMMAAAIPWIYKEMEEYECLYCEYQKYYDHWFINGGEETSKAFWNMSKEEIFAYKEKIDNMPLELRYTSPAGHTIIMEHAGYTPFGIPHRTHEPTWDRLHFGDKWDEGRENEDPDNTYLIHGHTPVQYLKYLYGYIDKKPLTKEEWNDKNKWLRGDYKECSKPTILRYCNGHKFDIDMCTIASGRGALLNLDTFEEIYIDGEIEDGQNNS